MANETELERLVVRVMGDDQGYRVMMNDVAVLTGKFSTLSRELDKTQRSVGGTLGKTSSQFEDLSSQTMGASRSFRFLGSQISNVGAITLEVNSTMGASILSLGRMTSAVGSAMHGVKALGLSFGSLKSMLTNNMFAVAAGGIVTLGAAAITAAYLVSSRAVNKAVEESGRIGDKSFTRSQEIYSQELEEHSQGVKPLDKIKSLSSYRTDVVSRFKAAQEKRQEAQGKLDRKWYQFHGKNWDEPEDILHAVDRPVYRQQVKEAETEAEAARQMMSKIDQQVEALKGSIRDVSLEGLVASEKQLQISEYGPIRPGHQLEDAFEAARDRSAEGYYPERERENDQIAMNLRQADANNVENAHKREVEMMDKKISRIGLLGAAEARQAAVDQALSEGKTETQARDMGELAAETRLKEEGFALSQSFKESAISEKYMASELAAAANPWSQELQAVIESAKAYEQWTLAHVDATEEEKKTQRAILETAAAHKVMMARMAEGRGLIERYQEPLDKMAASQMKLRTLWTSGALGQGEEGRRVFDKAMRDEYGRAHKEYTAQFMGQQYGALVGGTSETARALQEYRMGSTAIPLGQDKADQQLEAAREIAKGVKTLVDQGKQKNQLQAANL